jgi:hypothetical protein
MRKKLFYILMFLISLSLILIGAELLLRASGAKPWPILSATEPTLFEWDPVLGWKSQPGKFRHQPYSPQGHEINYTILSNGSRATSDNQKTDSYNLVFLGCSFTEGLAVSDEDTFAWKLQAKFPSLRIGNFGVGGYGTYQSLLLLRELYKHNMKPAIVIYGFLPFHEERNIANSQWRKLLTQHSKRGHRSLPYCNLDENGKLIEHKPIGYPLLPLREHLALTGDFAAEFYFRFFDAEEGKRREDGFAITQKLIAEMNSLAQKNGSSFFVAILAGPGPYESFFKTSAIGKIDCRIAWNSDENMVQGEGHPNEKAHSAWAERIAEFLKDQASLPGDLLADRKVIR